jgi:hypothetical protein
MEATDLVFTTIPSNTSHSEQNPNATSRFLFDRFLIIALYCLLVFDYEYASTPNSCAGTFLHCLAMPMSSGSFLEAYSLRHRHTDANTYLFTPLPHVGTKSINAIGLFSGSSHSFVQQKAMPDRKPVTTRIQDLFPSCECGVPN